MTINIKNIIICLCAIIALTACSSDFLDIDPEQNVPSENAVTDIKTLQTAINGVYSKLQSDAYYGRSMYVIPELMADNLYLSSRNTGRYLDFDNFIVNEENSYVEDTWNAIYEVIANATKAINGGEKLESTTPEQQKEIDQLIGEAYAIRALAHFDLSRLFAQPYNFTANADHLGVPIVSISTDENISPKRNTVSEVYAQINNDLSTAILNMTSTNNDGRFTKYAAKALAARVAIYQENYSNAIKYSSEVIAEGGYSLISNENYNDIWESEFNSESIFEIINTIADNEGTNSLGHYFDPSGYADALVTPNLYSSYDENDVRKTAITEGSKQGAEEDALFVYKFPKGTQYTDNIRILRLAEQYLIRAEAYAKNNEYEKAQTDLETIMRRANPNAIDVTETGQALIDKVIEERRKELAFEGNRLFDLNRNKKDIQIIQGENIIDASYPNDKFILPIPLDELNANPNIKPQNPGY
ncbi:RagB/SusD family nutrient uptake outer membrane protein [Joostella atrarenae]|uniref:RagB/SusD family nutrient uptake outer membrane protein n=1 Tax=Joostella atrarenae TaxID=679257 RepID=A0ABS9J4W7_9FLAO|nr:RagB/SusD family nutrient uptake outer membrane protein [Joostella atrarenae]MCF8715378.1 RagB/SusD family nutrient uptake outer membrane protein [Joostella atrarenae]